MLRSAWLYVIAAGLGALCLSAASAGERVTVNGTVLDCGPEGCFVVRYVPAPTLKPESESNQSGATGTNESSGKTDETDPEIITPRMSPQAPANQPPAKKKADYSYENLQANRGIKFWTMMAALFTGAGVILIWRTLREAQTTTRVVRLTLVSTRYGTNAARKANENTLSIGKKQVRAYLSANKSKVDLIEYLVKPGKPNEAFRFILTIRNTGNSPASTIRLSYIIEAFIPIRSEDFLRILEYEPVFKAMGTRKLATVGGGAIITTDAESGMFPLEVGEMLTREQLLIKIHGTITWVDEFGDDGEQAFRFSTKYPQWRTAFMQFDDKQKPTGNTVFVNMVAESAVA